MGKISQDLSNRDEFGIYISIMQVTVHQKAIEKSNKGFYRITTTEINVSLGGKTLIISLFINFTLI